MIVQSASSILGFCLWGCQRTRSDLPEIRFLVFAIVHLICLLQFDIHIGQYYYPLLLRPTRTMGGL
jgi:hypothetical protein